jgi:YidC/Oxa1 family membrane protein insertase
MSRPANTPKQNFLQTMLLVTTLFLAWNLFFNPQRNQPTSNKTSAQLLQQMREENAKLLDHTIARTESELEKQVNKEFSTNKLTMPDAERIRTEGALLVADASLKAGVHWNDTQRIRTAHAKLDKRSRDLANSPLWTKTTFDLPESALRPERFAWTQTPVTGEGFYNQIVTTLKERNRHDLIWGTIPGGHAFIDFLVRITGAIPSFSYWFAALLLAIVVRAIIYPLSQRQLMWSRQMSQLQPLVKEIRDQYTGQEQQVKMMELYREYGINPMAGCVPALVQMPLFLFVYQCMVQYQFDFERGTFLWINPASAAASHGFFGRDLGHLDYILIGLYAISMVISTLLAPISDPTQVKQQRMIGLAVAVIFPVFMLSGTFPVAAAFVLYWTFTNMLATAQSLRAYRLPLPPLVKVNTPTGGVYPGTPFGATPNGKGNGKMNGQHKTGTPAKHKPKKRK